VRIRLIGLAAREHSINDEVHAGVAIVAGNLQ